MEVPVPGTELKPISLRFLDGASGDRLYSLWLALQRAGHPDQQWQVGNMPPSCLELTVAVGVNPTNNHTIWLTLRLVNRTTAATNLHPLVIHPSAEFRSLELRGTRATIKDPATESSAQALLKAALEKLVKDMRAAYATLQ